jgi:uncharacterized repeat protein (TIGR03803 family)
MKHRGQRARRGHQATIFHEGATAHLSEDGRMSRNPNRHWSVAGVFLIAGAVIGIVLPGSVSAAAVYTESVLHDFCSTGGRDCTDGSVPRADFVADTSGDLYGTTPTGGAYGGGAVFELIPNKTKTQWTVKRRYSFCAEGGEQCLDGLSPLAGLTIDSSGNLYGATTQGGAYNQGTIYQLIPGATLFAEKVLYSFCAKGGLDCTDGAYPAAALVADQSGDLFGMTLFGGANGGGTVFELVPPKAGNAWTEKVLYSFCPQPNCADGEYPNGVFRDATGNIFGTTQFGGITFSGVIAGSGLVFELKP